MSLVVEPDPEWTPEKRERFKKLERFEPVPNLRRQRELKERVARGEFRDDVGRGTDPEPVDYGG